MKSNPHIAIIGAGSFGGWTALHLLQRGARITLVDSWGPANSRASSGGETRVMRGAYGPAQPYTEMAARSLALWGKYERTWKRSLLHRIGVLWMATGREDTFERGSLQMLRQNKIQVQEFSVRDLTKRWPQISFSGVEWGIYEPTSGYLEARASCSAVFDAFLAQGGSYLQAAVSPQHLDDGARGGKPLRAVTLSDKSILRADQYVFACGPWMGELFPRTIGHLIKSTKQDVFFFGTPPGDHRFDHGNLPVWAEHHGRFIYGIPGHDRRGFKVADDTRGPAFDPTSGQRVVSTHTLHNLRTYIALRFPALKEAPLIETRVCQYEQTPDGHFVIDRHPAMENVWLLGGGSGHGFKHGPAIGELMAKLILDEFEVNPLWKLNRFTKKKLPRGQIGNV